MLILFFIPILAIAQLPSGIIWDSAVGCQEATLEYSFNVEDEGECIRTCEHSTITYTLVGGIPTRWTDVNWQVVGGNLNNSTNTTATIQWGSQGWGVILVNIETLDGIYTKEVCVEIIPSPVALFNIVPKQDPIVVCKDAVIYFENLSNANGGSPLVSHTWHFSDDGTTSAEFEPSHVFLTPGSFTVTLTVVNDCNCSDSFEVEIEVREEPGLQIVCNSIACENELENYTVLDEEGEPIEGCERYSWDVQGGNIVNQTGSNISVLWNNVGRDGFGYVTFDPRGCDVQCARPVTIKVPVIKDDIDIDGPDKICEGEQFRYSIPQWSNTEVVWKTSPSGAQLFPSDQPNEIVFVAISPGNYMLEAIYTNTLKGCGGVSHKEIEVIPTLSIQGPTKLCVGDNEVFTNSDGLPVNWVLEGPSGVHTGSGTSFNHTFNVPGAYTLSLGENNFCLNSVHPIQVNPKPDAPMGIEGPLEVCMDTPITYSVDPPQGTVLVEWGISTGHGVFVGDGIGEEVDVIWDSTPSNPSIPYMLRVTYIKNGCSSDTEVITVVPLNVNFNFTGAQTVCSSSYETYNVGYVEGDKYEWSINPAYLGSVAEYPQNNEVEILWNDVSVPTQAMIEVKVEKCGSTYNLAYPVTVVNAPPIDIVAPTAVCRDEPVNFDITGLTGWNSIKWDFGDGHVVHNDQSP